MINSRRNAYFFWPIAVLAVALFGLLLFSGAALIESFDRRALEREQEVVANGMAGRIGEVAHMVVPQTVWDDAVTHLDNRLDRAWAQSNIMDYLSETDGFGDIYILDPAGKLAMSRQRGRPYATFSAQVAPLIAAVREGHPAAQFRSRDYRGHIARRRSGYAGAAAPIAPDGVRPRAR